MPFILAAPIIFNMPSAHPHSPLTTRKVPVRIHNFWALSASYKAVHLNWHQESWLPALAEPARGTCQLWIQQKQWKWARRWWPSPDHNGATFRRKRKQPNFFFPQGNDEGSWSFLGLFLSQLSAFVSPPFNEVLQFYFFLTRKCSVIL